MNFEEKLVLRAVHIFSIVLPIITLLSFILKLDLRFTVFTGLCSIIFPYLYLKSKKNCCFGKLQIIITIFLFIFLNMAWFFLEGSRGPVTSAFIVFVALLVFIWEKKQPIYIYLALIINLIGLFTFEAFKSEAHSEPVFTYIGAFVSSLLTFLLAYTAKDNYLVQYNKAKEADELKSTFLANISHELRTPLNAILGYTRLLSISSDPKSKEEYADIIDSNGDHLTRLINDIVDISILESGQMNLQPEKVHLKDLYGLMITLTENQLRIMMKHNLKIIPNLKVENPILLIDPVRLKQIWFNLITNAIKYTSRGEIKISVIENEADYIFSVEDTGIGIREADFKHLFHRFYKIDNGIKKLYRGTGLGLYLCKHLSDILGGRLEFTSKYGKGSTFWFSIAKEKVEFKKSRLNSLRNNLQ